MSTATDAKTTVPGGSFLLESAAPAEVFTPEDFTEQHQLIGQTAEEFAQNEIVPNIEKMEHKDFSVSRASAQEGWRTRTKLCRNSRNLRRA